MYRVCNCDSNISGNCEVHGNIPPSGGCSLEHAVSSNQAIVNPPVNINMDINDELYRKLSQEIIMRDVYEKQAERLQEQVDYLTAKLDAPRKLFSVKSYLDHMAAELGKDYLDAYMLVYKKSMDLTAYDWSSTWDKYREYFKHQYKTIPKESA